MTATLAKPKAKKQPKKSKAIPATRLTITTRPTSHKEVEIADVSPCRYQPRQDFPEAEIADLAASIEAQGQITPVLIRPLDDIGNVFELIAGERRLRAMKLLGRKTIRAEIGEYTDAEVRALVLIEAAKRKDFNEIEQGLAYKRMIQSGDVEGPTALAEQLGLSQGHVSNRLRLLDLPEAWQKKLISREITERHARAILPFKQYPRILDAIEAAIKKAVKDRKELPDCKAFESDILPGAVEESCRQIDCYQLHSEKYGRFFTQFKITPEIREQLGIIETKAHWGTNIQLATNVELFDKLQAEHVERVVAKEEKSAGKKAPTAKEAKADPAAARRHAQKMEGQFQQRLAELVTNVKRWVFARELRSTDTSRFLSSDILLLVLTAIAGGWHHSIYSNQLKDTIAKRNKIKKSDAWDMLSEMEESAVLAESSMFLADAFCKENNEPASSVHYKTVAALFDAYNFHLLEIWKAEQLGPFTEAYFNAHSKDQLMSLAEEWSVADPPEEKAELVKHLLDLTTSKNMPMPAELTAFDDGKPAKKSATKNKSPKAKK